MMWIDDEPTPGDPNNAGTTMQADMFTATVDHTSDFPNEDNTRRYNGQVLSITQAVDPTLGGVGQPGKLLSWSDGVISRAQKWRPLSGMVIKPPSTANLRAAQPYGQVGLLNHSQNLLLGTDYQDIGSLLPDTAAIAKSYTHPTGV